MAIIVFQVGKSHHKLNLDSTRDDAKLLVGRAFESDFILPDSHIAARQFLIRKNNASTDSWRLTNLDGTNPLSINNKPTSARETIINSGDKLSIGRTTMHVFSERHPVADVRKIGFAHSIQKTLLQPAIAIAALICVFGLMMISSYLTSCSEPKWGQFASTSIGLPVVILIWAGVWSLSGRFLRHHHYFFPHLFFSSMAVNLLIVFESVGGYVDFLFSSVLAGGLVAWLSAPVIIGVAIGYNLKLATAVSRPFVKGMVTSLGITVVIGALALLNQDGIEQFAPTYSKSFKPPYVPVTSVVETTKYIDSYSRIFQELSDQIQDGEVE